MAYRPIHLRAITGSRLRPAILAAVTMLTSLLPALQAQTYTVIHQFTNASDGGAPLAGLTISRDGSKFYGTTSDGGQGGVGTVYQLQQRNSAWILSPLYTFTFRNEDGTGPNNRVTIAPDGTLYGSTFDGGVFGCVSNLGCGTVYRLQPPMSACRSALCYWTGTTVYSFSGAADGAYPEGDLIFDPSGKIYGATNAGGNTSCNVQAQNGCGVVYSLTTSGTQSVIYAFPGGAGGSNPTAGVIQDQAGNLYGTASTGGSSGCEGTGCGIVYELSPNGSGWTETTLYTFQGSTDGIAPMGGLIFDGAGNLYGTTARGGANGGGTVFELTPNGGQWNFNLLYSLTIPLQGHDFPGPAASLTMDAAGNLYGTTVYDGADSEGAVFKLAHSGGSWNYTSLHDFTGGIDGAQPRGSLIFDSQGNLYGTASAGGTNEGVAFQIMQ